MKKWIRALLCITGLTVIIVTYFTTRGYSDEYVQWIGNNNPIYPEHLALLERNDIPYKIKGNKLYIPEDAVDKAIMCCS
ncbi:hypothetical protein A3863_07595 (plasmid) [Priestia endophytica]|uniref:hypothetical protein n=1 Tax=Priestia endophytica TaxID=135735 RepID=UPI000DCA47F5|nr:hypothetical protein [Priestia endophytica]RAS90839.1 hypothetical protein A3863_07595 [Priestia endophytica]